MKLKRFLTTQVDEQVLYADSRSITYVFSDESVARDGHTILNDGWILDNFKANPVFLWCHDASSPPIGRVTNISNQGSRLIGTVEYADAETYEFADTIYRLTKGGYLNAVSVSWQPLKWKWSQDKSRPGGIDFQEQELLEVSAVPVPALPTALATARASGIDTRPLYDWAEKILDSGDKILVPRAELELLRREAKPPAAPNEFEKVNQMYKDTTIQKRKNSPLPFVSVIPKSVELAQTHRSNSDDVIGFGKFLQDVVRAETFGDVSNRLVRAPSGASEGDPAGGGFLVPTAFTEDLLQSAYAAAVLAPLCTKLRTGKQGKTSLPSIDETSRADGSRSGGASSYWAAEAASVSASFPRLKSIDFELNKLVALAQVTNELLEDVPLLDFMVKQAFSNEISFKLDLAIFSGDNIGKPSGILKSSSLVTIAKDAGQAAATISNTNVDAMWSALALPCRKRAVWLVNEDAEKQLSNLSGSSDGGPLYTPVGAFGNEFPMLKGRPVLAIEQANPLGVIGDIVLCDLSQYFLIGNTLKEDLSLHVNFASDQSVFRFVLRIDGAPGWSSPVVSYNGTGNRSAFVALAPR